MPLTPRLEPQVVTEQAQLAALVADLLAQPAVAVDTESNSLYAYHEQVCLIQFSTPGRDCVVDALARLDLSSLGQVFADPRVEKVFHAAEYDILCLKRDFGFRFANVFDTMLAARVLGWRRVGLGDLLSEHFGVSSDKRYQRFDWGQRPLPPEALRYAALDTHFLLPLREIQAAALVECGRWEEAREAFAQVADTSPVTRGTSPHDFWRIRGAAELDERGRAVLRELALWRDREAKRLNRPPFKVLPDHTLVALAALRPRAPADLTGLPGLKAPQVRRYGERILLAIRQGERAPAPPPPPEMHPRPQVVRERYSALRQWRRQVAAARGVEPDVVLSNATLLALAERNPHALDGLERIPGLGPWKRSTYGPAILEVLRQVAPAQQRPARKRET
jgi:ribonuclease D